MNKLGLGAIVIGATLAAGTAAYVFWPKNDVVDEIVSQKHVEFSYEVPSGKNVTYAGIVQTINRTKALDRTHFVHKVNLTADDFDDVPYRIEGENTDAKGAFEQGAVQAQPNPLYFGTKRFKWEGTSGNATATQRRNANAILEKAVAAPEQKASWYQFWR
jgi:hypothetical protein